MALLVPSLFLNQHKSFEGGVIECILFFFAGGLTWLLQERTPERFRMGVAMGMIVAVLGCWAGGWMHAPKTLLLLGVTPGVICLAHLPAWNGLAKLCNRLGHLTYSSYLLHFPISLLLVWFFRELGLDPIFFLKPGSFILILIGILSLSWLSYRYLEEPCQNWIRRKSIPPNPGFVKAR
jgi:peptidoglycan/LPS O-acetylase OafA/YrhL